MHEESAALSQGCEEVEPFELANTRPKVEPRENKSTLLSTRKRSGIVKRDYVKLRVKGVGSAISELRI